MPQYFQPYFNIIENYISVTVYFTSGKKHPVMIIDGYEFKLFHRSSNCSVWACTQNVKHKCKVRLLTKGRELQIKAVSHTHQTTYKGGYQGLYSQIVSVVYCSKLNVMDAMNSV